MNELNVEILVNGESIKVDSYQFLSAIVEILPEEDERFQKLYEEAAKSLSKEVRCSVAYKDNLSEKTLKLLLQDKDTDVLTTLLETEAGQNIVEFEDLQRMIHDIGSHDLLITIAQNITDFRNCDPNWIAEKLISHEDPAVRLELANNLTIPIHILKRLLKDRDSGIRFAAQDSLESVLTEHYDEDDIPY